MRRILIYVVFAITHSAFGQIKAFDFSILKFKGLDFSVPKETLISTLGQGEINSPQYECGFYSNDQPGGPYYQIVFNSFNYIGSDSEKFILEHVHFDSDSSLSIQYGKWLLNGYTTKADLFEIFGDYVKTYFANNPDNNDILIFDKSGDDGVIFTFKNERLIGFQYWSPC